MNPERRNNEDGVRRYEHISSTANDTAKLLKSLDRKKARVESGLFLAEGARLIEEAMQNGWSPVYVIAGLAALERDHTASLLIKMNRRGARVLTATEKVLASVSRKDNPQTVIAAFRQRTTDLASLPSDGAKRWVALYEVRDPGNLGTVIRTADAAGCDGVILIGHTCDPFSVEAVRATMGSLFAMPIVSSSFEGFNSWRRAVGANLVAASMRGIRPHHMVKYGARSVILMGNEQAGLPIEVEAACDELALIPMMGRADSLNMSAAASLMIYEAWREHGFTGARS